MNPVLFQFGPISLHWYGVFIVGGAIIGAYLAGRTAAKAGQNPDLIWNMLAIALIFGIIGARLYHVLSTPANGIGFAYYVQHPLEAINFWNGGFRGLGIYGGLVFGVGAIAIYAAIKRFDLLMYLDFVAPNVLLAQAIGRLGNFANQELYGPPTNLPWAFHINPNYPCQTPTDLPANIQICGTPEPLTQATRDYYATHGFHPTFFYEALGNLVAFGILTFLFRRYGNRFRKGDGVLAYFIAYPIVRFVVEMFRPDAWTMGSLATAQWFGLACIGISVVLLIVRHVGWNWREHPEDSMIYMMGVNPDTLRQQPEAAPTAS